MRSQYKKFGRLFYGLGKAANLGRTVEESFESQSAPAARSRAIKECFTAYFSHSLFANTSKKNGIKHENRSACRIAASRLLSGSDVAGNNAVVVYKNSGDANTGSKVGN
jgi:hypothetical protein